MNEKGFGVVGVRRPDLLRRMRRTIPLMAVAWWVMCLAPQSAVGGEIAEAEPNNSTAQANALAPGQFGRGVITYSSGPAYVSNNDIWRNSASVGDLIFVFVDARESSDLKLSLLAVINNDGATVLESDAWDGPPAGDGDGSVVAGAVVSQAGNVFYTVYSNSAPAATSTLSYRLYQAVVKPTESAPEQEPNNTVATANAITARMMTGTVSGLDVDYFKVYVPAGERLVVIMDDNPNKDAVYTDTELSILGSDGTLLANGDNVGYGGSAGAGDANAAAAIVAPGTGVCYIRVAHGGEAAAMDMDYRFVVLVDGATAPLDGDTDGIADGIDNCPTVANANQADADGNGIGDACDVGGTGNGNSMGSPACGACGAGASAMVALGSLMIMGTRLRRLI